ncbi:hypothetical protein NDU88_001550 [Pleurodeles waltl]|uniref:Uncharacterized protein n=1 Tax=Pleurodeles waltl TaxID=8319 RepID=A0AAV7R7J2_PLEWA|nr:hypothetical protein NDU88_001550 [Pleurodeles waltl]
MSSNCLTHLVQRLTSHGVVVCFQCDGVTHYDADQRGRLGNGDAYARCKASKSKRSSQRGRLGEGDASRTETHAAFRTSYHRSKALDQYAHFACFIMQVIVETKGLLF